jgi:hypothetical protein
MGNTRGNSEETLTIAAYRILGTFGPGIAPCALANEVLIVEASPGGQFRSPIGFEKPLPPGSRIRATFLGPDVAEESERIHFTNSDTMPLMGKRGRYLLDGRIPENAPDDFYRTSEIELTLSHGTPKSQMLANPDPGAGIQVGQPKPSPPPELPKITSIG